MKSQFDLQQNGFICIKNSRTGIEVRFHIKSEKGGRILYRKRSKRWVKLGQIIDGRVELTSVKAELEVNRLYRDVLNNPKDGGPAPLAAIVVLGGLPINRKLAATFVTGHLRIL